MMRRRPLVKKRETAEVVKKIETESLPPAPDFEGWSQGQKKSVLRWILIERVNRAIAAERFKREFRLSISSSQITAYLKSPEISNSPLGKMLARWMMNQP
jgi:hypothetical protein